MAHSTINLKKIADEARVSVTTVSRVLRGKGEISEETRSKVKAVAERFRYRPNLMAQSIYTGRTNLVGVIIPAASTFDVRISFGIHDALSEADLVPIVLWTPEEGDKNDKIRLENVLRQIHHLVDRRVDGVILRPQNDFRELYIGEILAREIPLVTVDRDYLGSHADFVGTDDVMGSRMVASHLLALGHREFVHVAGPQSVTTGLLRREAFEMAIAAVPDATCVTLVDNSFGREVDIAMRVFDVKPRPTAVFAANDWIARNVYKAARRHNLRIPEDVSVVGFADTEIATMLDPQLTTIRQQPYEIGLQAARILLKRIDGSEVQNEPISRLLAPELIVRGSTMNRGAEAALNCSKNF
jgi:LacI family transcriptional regulator